MDAMMTLRERLPALAVSGTVHAHSLDEIARRRFQRDAIELLEDIVSQPRNSPAASAHASPEEDSAAAP